MCRAPYVFFYFVCLSVCLAIRPHISEITRSIFTKSACYLQPVDRSSSDGVAICYVGLRPVLWMTPCFRIKSSMARLCQVITGRRFHLVNSSNINISLQAYTSSASAVPYFQFLKITINISEIGLLHKVIFKKNQDSRFFARNLAKC